MQHYLHIGGDKDSLSFPASDDAKSMQWQKGLTDKETYATLDVERGRRVSCGLPSRKPDPGAGS